MIAEIPKVSPQLVARAEDCQPFIFRSGERCRILEPAMQALCRTKEHGAGFAGIVTDRNHIIEMPSLQFVDVF